MYRVWRYRGGRDGHETLQQFMNFLGREKAESEPEPTIIHHGGESPHEGVTAGQEEGARTEHDKGVTSSNKQRGKIDDVSIAKDKGLGPNTYAGVVIFCVPIVAKTDRRDVDFNIFQVWEQRMQHLKFISDHG